MTRFKRKMIYSAIGLLGGLLAWSLSALSLKLATSFPSFLSFSLVTGFLLGGSLGAYFGSLEGLTQSVRSKMISGIRMGVLFGGLGGILGFLLGQGFLLFFGDYFIHSTEELRQWGLPLSKVISWVILGAILGSIEGLRSLSLQKIKVGIIGGAIGGLFGGFALEFLPLWLPALVYADLIGLCLLGLAIGGSFGLIEEQFSTAVLRVLNGPFKGKEYLLLAKKSRIGEAPKGEICLSGYRNMAPLAARAVINKGQVYLEKLSDSANLKVNDQALTTNPLAGEDIIQVGSAKFIFYYR